MPDISPTSPGWIFISYRRDETAYAAGWLYDRLADRFGADKIFKDIDSIELGDDFVEVITTAVGSCDVLLALIGDEWLTITGEDGQRRLDDPADFVRVEIEAALTHDVRVIPVLVDGATMPHAESLPAGLSKLVRRQALELSPSRFDFDTGRLLTALDEVLAGVQAKVAATAPPLQVSTATDEALAQPPSTPAPLERAGEAPTPTIPHNTRPSGWRRQLGRLSTRTRIVAAGAAVVVLLLLIVAAVGDSSDSEEHGTESIAAEIPTGARPFRIAANDDGIWVTDSRATTVDRIDPATNTVVDQVEIGGEPAGIDANSFAVWVSDFDNGTVDVIGPATNQVVSVDVGNGPRNVSATETAVWVANIDDNTVSHIDVATAAVQNISVGLGPRGIVATNTDVWVTNVNDGNVMRIDAAADEVIATIPTGGEPGSITLTSDAVWVTDSSQDQVIKIDPATNTVVGQIPVGADPGGMTSTDDTVYVSNSGDDTVYAIDAATSEITDSFETGSKPGGLAVTDTDLWVANTNANTVSRIPLS